MSADARPESLSISGLAHRCAQESSLFFRRQQHDPRFCFELFRRAVMDGDQSAWDCLFRQYQPLVASWVERHSLFPSLGEEREYFVNWAFEKMWSVLTPQKFSHFPDLKSILRYLQMCVHSVLVDYSRSRQQVELLEDLLGEPQNLSDPLASGMEERLLQHTQAEELWALLKTKLKDEKELHVIYGSYVLAYKPGELCERYPAIFADVREVYRVKENVLARLRRDGDLADFFQNF